MDINIAGIFYSKEEIASRVRELASEIEECFGDEDIVIVGVQIGRAHV